MYSTLSLYSTSSLLGITVSIQCMHIPFVISCSRTFLATVYKAKLKVKLVYLHIFKFARERIIHCNSLGYFNIFVIFSEDGSLFTAGWNSYGQLCLGDTRDRSCFTSVPFFRNHRYRMKDVQAQAWNTIIYTESTVLNATK